MFMGEDDREFWERAEQRNRATARLYDELGMAEYEAMEAFVKYYPWSLFNRQFEDYSSHKIHKENTNHTNSDYYLAKFVKAEYFLCGFVVYLYCASLCGKSLNK